MCLPPLLLRLLAKLSQDIQNIASIVEQHTLELVYQSDGRGAALGTH